MRTTSTSSKSSIHNLNDTIRFNFSRPFATLILDEGPSLETSNLIVSTLSHIYIIIYIFIHILKFIRIKPAPFKN